MFSGLGRAVPKTQNGISAHHLLRYGLILKKCFLFQHVTTSSCCGSLLGKCSRLVLLKNSLCSVLWVLLLWTRATSLIREKALIPITLSKNSEGCRNLSRYWSRKKCCFHCRVFVALNPCSPYISEECRYLTKAPGHLSPISHPPHYPYTRCYPPLTVSGSF